jgi:hypothetical protein
MKEASWIWEEKGYLNEGHCMYRERKRDLPPSKVELDHP